MAVERFRTATANDAFKAGYRKTMDVALAISLAAHLLAFAFAPSVDFPRARPEPEELELVEIEAPPEIEIPAPPEEIARPTIPIEEPSADVEAASEVADVEETNLEPDVLPEGPWAPPPPPPSPPGGGDGGWLTFDRPPKPRRMPMSDADYPEAARTAEIEGAVLVKATIDEHGRVVDAVVLRSDSSLFDAAALRVVRRWEFLPAERDGVPVRSTITVPVRFTLDR